MLYLRSLLLLFPVMLVLGGCSEPNTGPAKVHWDRDACERCRMVLSDRHHAAQVRQHLADGKSKVYLFDDIGCAVVWLNDKPWADASGTEIWVNDWRSGDWLNARTATYLPDQITPMEYGFGAQAEPDPAGLDFARMRQRVLEKEGSDGRHGMHMGNHDMQMPEHDMQMPKSASGG
jgi:hypothetical protein